MPSPIEKTFQVLAASKNASAAELLIPALDSGTPTIRTGATRALLKRRGTRGLTELIRYLDQLPPAAQTLVEASADKFNVALKQALLHGDSELKKKALALVGEFEVYDQVGALVEMLSDDDSEFHDEAAQTVADLVNRLYEHANYGKGTKANPKYLRNVPQVTVSVLQKLDQGCTNFDRLAHAEDVVAGVLTLGDPNNFAVKKVLTQGSAACREAAERILRTSTHPGVMQLLVDFLSKNYPPRLAFEIIAVRDDPEFVAHLLRAFPKRLSGNQLRNFQQVESVAWVSAEPLCLEIIPPALQESLIAFVLATGLPEHEKLLVQEWVVRHGSQDGRMAAAEVLSSIDQHSARKILVDGLESEDPNVQTWATGQLRSQGVPEALGLLIERLDSPVESVRDAARAELGSFDLQLMINLHGHLDPKVCRQAGALVRKIDPNCIAELVQELASPLQRRRIEVAHAAYALGLHEEVVPSLLAMLEDDDALVRRTGVEILQHVRSRPVMDAIQKLLEDPSPRVREQAVHAFESQGD